ncbi:MAG TPA: SpoIID/LytB domain-containing protein [Myxococcales bacterium]|nr:SpoIID/LytB domain-containing protein [Myxococcales bacterium]
MKRRALLQTLLGSALFSRFARGQAAGVEDLFSGAPAPDDPLELLYSRRLSFDDGQPLITVRVAEGRQQIAIVPKGPLHVSARVADGELKPAVSDGAQGRWVLQLVEASPGVGASWVELEQLRFEDKAGVQAARDEWAKKGVQSRVATVGEAYGIAGHVVDTRRYAVLAEGDATEAGARRQAAEIEKQFGVRVQIHRELAARPRGRIELRDPSGAVAVTGDTALELRAAPGIAVEQVEFGMGYSFHGFEDRTYPGRLFATVDASGALALVAALPMERLVKGVVPSEIFAKAHIEALKAQAVTARGEVLAKIGARHLGDPYLLCSEQHCQVYKGISAELPGPSAAVDATRGEALFAAGGGSKLVDSVYSAVCGGFTENNDAVWGGPPDPSLRGRPDFDTRAPKMRGFLNGIGEALVARFVRLDPVPSYCALSGFARPDKVRWTRRFSLAEVDEICVPLNVGAVKRMVVEGRGVSGRARALRIEGAKGTARVYGELPIRRLFHNLNSGMFVVAREGGSWVFTGGGWGHGSGMCQTGAVGRAERGASYRDILGWYYSGAAPVRIY